MTNKSQIEVENKLISIVKQDEQDYISLTDMVRDEEGSDHIHNWMRNRNTIEFIGLWETSNSPNFKHVEFDTFRKQAELNSFNLTSKKWIEAINAIGIVSKSGRYGGTYAHKDLAFDFGSWISPSCKRKSLLSLHFRHVQPIVGGCSKMCISGIILQILSILLFNLHALPVFGQTATCSIPISADYRAELNVDSNYFPGSKLYLAGEVHNIKSNPIVKFQLLKHLHANNNVRYYLIEAGPATSYLLNKFLKTGNEDYRISYFLSEPDFWSNLLLFNESVDKINQIKVIGFDFDLNHIYQKALIDLLNEIQKHDLSINRMIETVIQSLKKGVDESNRDEINRQLVKFFESLPNREKVKIGKPLSTILSIINNRTPVTSRVKRDKITFQAIIESNIGFGRVFGQYGVSHVNLRLKNLSHLLQNDKRSPFYQEVTILGYQYYNCESVWQMDTVFYHSIGIMNQINSKIRAIENPDHDLTLVDLTCVDQNTGRLGRSADYIIICRNQKVSVPANNVQH